MNQVTRGASNGNKGIKVKPKQTDSCGRGIRNEHHILILY